jgi:hypothetical protein
MLWLAVFCTFCAPPAIGLIVALVQREPELSRGFEVIVIQPVVDEDEIAEGN